MCDVLASFTRDMATVARDDLQQKLNKYIAFIEKVQHLVERKQNLEEYENNQSSPSQRTIDVLHDDVDRTLK